MAMAPIEDQVDHVTSKINKNSNPSELRITDLRIAEVTGVMFRTPIIRICTNQGIVGHGDVRDGAASEYALMLKHLLLGENPTHVERLFNKIKQFGFHARQAGEVCGVEMALCDLGGKAYGVPVHCWAASTGIKCVCMPIQPPTGTRRNFPPAKSSGRPGL